MRRAWWRGGGALALLAALALVLSGAAIPPAARAAVADPFAALLDICTAHEGSVAAADVAPDQPLPPHAHEGCGDCIVATGAAIGPAAAPLPQPRLRPLRLVAGRPPFAVRPVRRRFRPPPTAPPSPI